MVNARHRVKAIPPAAANRIAQAYGYDPVIVVGPRLDASGGEGKHVTAWAATMPRSKDAERLGKLARRTILRAT